MVIVEVVQAVVGPGRVEEEVATHAGAQHQALLHFFRAQPELARHAVAVMVFGVAFVDIRQADGVVVSHRLRVADGGHKGALIGRTDFQGAGHAGDILCLDGEGKRDGQQGQDRVADAHDISGDDAG